MRLARKNKLHWALRIFHQVYNVVELLEDQRRAFVGRETTCKANGQRIGIEQLIEGDEIALRQALSLQEQPPARKFNQLPPQPVAQGPQLLVRNKIRIDRPLPE